MKNFQTHQSKKVIHKRMMSLFTRLYISDELRHEMVYAFTDGRTESTRELSVDEMLAMIKRLEGHLSSQINADDELTLRRKRSVVLTIATRTGIKKADSWKEFNEWMLKYSVLKKPLLKYDISELKQLIAQFRQLERNYNQSAEKAGTKAFYHKTGIPSPSKN